MKKLLFTVSILLLIILMLAGCGETPEGTKIIESSGPQQSPQAREKGDSTEKQGEQTAVQDVQPVENKSDEPAAPKIDQYKAADPAAEPMPEETKVPEVPVITEPAFELGVPVENENGKMDSYGGFFDDALFIGDSRSVGLTTYGQVGSPTTFVNTGLSVYNYDDDPLQVEGFGKIMLTDLLEQGSFNKVYIGLGINELGYGQDATVEQFRILIDSVKASQPQATVYMLGNLHVTAARSKKDKTYNNDKINSLNDRIAALCDGTKIIYIDGNSVFDDEEGNLSKEFTGDNTHLYARCYPSWSMYIYEHSNH